MFPRTTEYALRAMAHLATLPQGTSAPACDLAEASKIPRHYVSKLMRRLVVAQLVISQRGHGGGFTLARQPKDIYFMDILKAVGFSIDSNQCGFGWDTCDPNKPCPLHPSWSRLRTTFLDWAKKTTLGEVRNNWFENLSMAKQPSEE